MTGTVSMQLTHWGRVTHICLVKLTIIGSDNGLSPGRSQAIIWTNAGILLIGPLETNFIEILIGIQTFSFKKMHLKMSSATWHPFCLGLNVLNMHTTLTHWGQEKMAAIFQTIFSKLILLNENVWIFIKISLMFVPTDPINDIPAPLQIMPFGQTANKPLFELKRWLIY